MPHADAQTAPAHETAILLSGPSWLIYLEKAIEEKRQEEFADVAHHEIIRDMLLAPDEDDTAVPEAVQSFQKNYVAGFADEDFGKRKPPEYAAGDFLNSVSLVAFGAADHVPFTDIRHDRLTKFLIDVKSSAVQEFKSSKPQLVYYGWGLETAAAESWNGCQADEWTQDNEYRTASQAANRWINLSALLAKLYNDGMLDSDGPLWISADFENAFEKKAQSEYAANIGRQSQVLATANYILIAGEALVKEVKTPSQKWWFELSREKWVLWASKLQDVANKVGADAPWGLKARAQEAHDRMVQLYPEAFRDNE